MEALRGWIINICTTVFFITAVEMILPDNNLKKYSKFVLGLILMTVIINPLVKFLNQGSEITALVNQATVSVENQLQDNSKGLKESSIKDTLNVFKANLEKLCEQKLKQKYPKDSSEVTAEVQYDGEQQQYTIKSIKVAMDKGAVSKVDKIQINTSTNAVKNNIDDSKYALEVKSYLSTVLELPEDRIIIQKRVR